MGFRSAEQEKILHSPALQRSDVPSGAEALALDSNFNCREAHGHVLGNFFAVRKTIFDVQSDGVFNICDGLLVCVSLAVAPL
jgi:hypothetical protein